MDTETRRHRRATPLLGRCLRLLALLALVAAAPAARATHTGVLIDARAGISIVETGISQILNPQYSYAAGHASLTGALVPNQQPALGKRAVSLLGEVETLILFSGIGYQSFSPDPNQEPLSVELFQLDVYTDPAANFDRDALLAGFSLTTMLATAANACPLAFDCAAAPDGSYDITFEIGNYPDSFRIAVQANQFLPEPTSLALGLSALLALAALRAGRRTQRQGIAAPGH